MRERFIPRLAVAPTSSRRGSALERRGGDRGMSRCAPPRSSGLLVGRVLVVIDGPIVALRCFELRAEFLGCPSGDD